MTFIIFLQIELEMEQLLTVERWGAACKICDMYSFYFCNDVRNPVTVILRDNLIIRNVNSSILRIFSPFLNSILGDIPPCDLGTNPEIILPDVDEDCFNYLMEMLVGGSTNITSLTKSGKFTVNEILSLAKCLGVTFKSLKIIDRNEGDETENETTVRISKISQNFLDSMVPNLLEIHNNNTTATETEDSSISRIDLSSDGIIDSSSDTDTEDDLRSRDSPDRRPYNSRSLESIRRSCDRQRRRMDKNEIKASNKMNNNDRLENAVKLKNNGNLTCNFCLPLVRKFRRQEDLDQHCIAKHGLKKQLGKYHSIYRF